jgi:hypothetical protein
MTSSRRLYSQIVEDMLANNVGWLTAHELYERAKEAGKLPENADYGKIQRELRKLAEESKIERIKEGNLIRYGRGEQVARSKLLERDLDQPLIDWLVTRGIEATVVQAPGGRGERGEHHHTFPDVVGSRHLAGRNAKLRRLGDKTGSEQLELYSFEVKRTLTRGSLRKAVLECVGNSSWAHYKYVVAHEIDERLYQEKKSLFEAHGVGLIDLRTQRSRRRLTFLPTTRELHVAPRGELDMNAVHEYYERHNWRPFREWIDSLA